MARQRPSTTSAFGSIPGVGQKKLADYGEQFVSHIGRYCTEHGIETDQSGHKVAVTLEKPSKQKMTIKAKQDAFDLFAAGQTVEQVAPQIDRAITTTSGYLGEFIQLQKITDPSPWVDAETTKKIHAAATQIGTLDRLAPIKELLGEDFTYEQIRIVVECLKVETGYIRT